MLGRIRGRSVVTVWNWFSMTNSSLNQVNFNLVANSNQKRRISAIMSHFSHIQIAPPDEVFNTQILYKGDTSPNKVDLGIGAYRTDEGKPLVLQVVRKAEKVVHENKQLNHEYLSIDGDSTFVKLARQLLFGKDSPAVIDQRIATVQSISGTGGLRVGCEFIKRFLQPAIVYVSKPTWGNHFAIFNNSGLEYKQYRYWNAMERKLDLSGLLEDLKNASNKSVILLHACAHNPTGIDPTKEEWKQIASVMREKDHLPFFDSAYQGFASGSLEVDAWAIRYFVQQGFNCVVSQSFAKNFGLYNERIGTLSVVCSNKDEASAVLSQLKMVIRPMYSNPPAQGARVVATILDDAGLFKEWVSELEGMAERIQGMRVALRQELERLGTKGDWSHITTQIGMFSFTGLTPAQCEYLMRKHHIYLLKSGRISMAGLNTRNVKYVAEAIHDAVENVQ